MKIRIDDDYDKADLEKFNINHNSSNYRNEQNEEDILQGNVIDAAFQEVKNDDKD
ncbi:hypothetical protein H9X78_05155, partial [Clostridium saudiense]|nr:hypothetical protein [Clostridium saudiense]